MVRIILEEINEASENGIVKIWKIGEGSELNYNYISNVPIWKFLTAKTVYKLLIIQEIEIDETILNNNFTKIY